MHIKYISTYYHVCIHLVHGCYEGSMIRQIGKKFHIVLTRGKPKMSKKLTANGLPFKTLHPSSDLQQGGWLRNLSNFYHLS